MTRLRKRFLDCRNPQPLTMEECTQYAERLIAQQRDVNFHIGDLSRYAAAAWPETWHQIFPVEDPSTSPGLIHRTSGVCRAYPLETDRAHEATYSQYQQGAGKPDRQSLLADMVAKGLTTDESRKTPKPDKVTPPDGRPRWLLVVDVHYYLHRWYYGPGDNVEAAHNVT